MFPLILLLCALAGAVIGQAFIRMLAAPSGLRVVAERTPAVLVRKRVASTELSAKARRAELRHEIGDWENEGGSVMVGFRRDSVGGPR
jgi:hypothetical protein